VKKLIGLHELGQGKVFELGGVRWVKLDEVGGADLCVTESIPEGMEAEPFSSEGADREDRNNFQGSYLQDLVWIELLEIREGLEDALVERPIDLTTMDGMTDYGRPMTRVRVLTIDEYRKYRRWIPLVDKRWWLATGWTALISASSTATEAYYVDVDGTVAFETVTFPSIAARPAAYFLASTLVTVDERVDLSGVSNKEILEELARRVDRHE